MDQIHFLLCSLESRGADATGIAIVNPGDTYEIAVHKDDIPASEYVGSKGFENFTKKYLKDDTETVLLHTRFATQGSPRRNENNHPMFSGVSAVVHNGCISNDDELFRELKLERKAETDSDILRAIVDEHGIDKKAIRVLNKVRGSCAAAIVSQKTPQRLLLLRSGSPLFLAATPTQLLWASTKAALHLATRPWTELHGEWFQYGQSNAAFSMVVDNTAKIYGPLGKEWHDTFSSCSWYNTPSYERVHSDFSSRNDRWDADKPEYVTCPNTSCKHHKDALRRESHQKNTPLWNLICPTCKTPLAEKPAEETQVTIPGD